MASFTSRRKRDGSTVWDAQVRVIGYPAQSRSFPTKLAAKLWAQQTEHMVRGAGGYTAASTITLNDLLDKVEPRLRRKNPSALTYWRAHLGNLRVSKITPHLIATHRDRLLGSETRGNGYRNFKRRGPATVWGFLQALHRAFVVAEQDLYLVNENPVSKVRRPSLPKGRLRFLSDDEITALLDSCRVSENTDLRAFVLMAITTGARRGELRALEWQNVDVERKWAVFPVTKNGDARGIPLTQPTLEALMALERAGPYVFPTDPTRAFRTAVRRAGLQNVTLHTLRHSCASYLVRRGASLPEIGRLLGHRDVHSTNRYAHLADQHTAALVHRLMQDVE
jgi:integrase